MPKLLLASRNAGKVREFRELLKGLGLELVSAVELGINLEVKETGTTYAENAARKASVYARYAGLLALGDDSGLEVDALNGLPGLVSARFYPLPGAADADRRAYLLKRLQAYPRPWKAQFRCNVALATPAGEVFMTEGICHGEIIPEERGTNGFGYDPIFLISGIGLTMAELSMEEKNRLSHRAVAVKRAIPAIVELTARD